MKIKIAVVIIAATLMSCVGKMVSNVSKQSPFQLAGTWQLITGTLIEKGDTIVTDYTKNISFIKIINATHSLFYSMI
jgi:hypothetical protein